MSGCCSPIGPSTPRASWLWNSEWPSASATDWARPHVKTHSVVWPHLALHAFCLTSTPSSARAPLDSAPGHRRKGPQYRSAGRWRWQSRMYFMTFHHLVRTQEVSHGRPDASCSSEIIRIGGCATWRSERPVRRDVDQHLVSNIR
jgi:hypothetical protein